MVKDDEKINKYFPNYSNGKLPSSDFFFGVCLSFIKILTGTWIRSIRFLFSCYSRLSNQKALSSAAWRDRKIYWTQEKRLRSNKEFSMDLEVRRFLITIFVLDQEEKEFIYSRKVQRYQEKERRECSIFFQMR